MYRQLTFGLPRTRLGNAQASLALRSLLPRFNKTLKKSYEGLGNTMSTYNAFVQANINVVKVFITKKVRSNGGSVLAPYQISRGTLPSIAYEKGAGDVLVTNLSLGSLVIDAETVVGELAEAIVANNAEWETGDQLTFFYGRQSVDAVTETPRAVIVGTKVVLDVADSTPLWEITGSLGFSSVAVSGGYVLGMNRSIVDGAAAWIHSRESQGGEDLRVGTQSLFVDSSVLAQWQGDSAFDASADSYGGINSQSVYLDPKAIRRRGVSQQVSSPVEWETISGSTVQGSGGSGSGASGSGSETGGQSSSSGNGDEGTGGSGGSGSNDNQNNQNNGGGSSNENTGGSGSGENTGGGSGTGGSGGEDEPGGDDH